MLGGRGQYSYAAGRLKAASRRWVSHCRSGGLALRWFVGANGKAGILARSVVIRVCQGHDTSTSCRFICFRLAASIETRVAAHALREVYKLQDSVLCAVKETRPRQLGLLSGWAQIKGILVFYNLHITLLYSLGYAKCRYYYSAQIRVKTAASGLCTINYYAVDASGRRILYEYTRAMDMHNRSYECSGALKWHPNL